MQIAFKFWFKKKIEILAAFHQCFVYFAVNCENYVG